MARCDSYAPGNCTIGACRLADWVPDYLGDGGDWAANWQARGGALTQQPTAGAIVSYCRGDGYSVWGHVAYVEQVYDDGTFLVKEMNYLAFDTYDERRSNDGDVCGFLLGPGVTPGQRLVPARGGPPAASSFNLPGEIVNAWEGVRWWSNDGHNLEWTRISGTWSDIDRWGV